MRSHHTNAIQSIQPKQNCTENSIRRAHEIIRSFAMSNSAHAIRLFHVPCIRLLLLVTHWMCDGGLHMHLRTWYKKKKYKKMKTECTLSHVFIEFIRINFVCVRTEKDFAPHMIAYIKRHPVMYSVHDFPFHPTDEYLIRYPTILNERLLCLQHFPLFLCKIRILDLIMIFFFFWQHWDWDIMRCRTLIWFI